MKLRQKRINAIKSRIQEFFEFTETRNMTLSNKLKSELISSIVEDELSIIKGMVAPKIDMRPDLEYKGHAVEIKTSYKPQSWQSGKLTKREGTYIMVAWDDTDGIKLSISVLSLLKDDWDMGSDTVYRTTIKKSEVFEKNPKYLIGNIEKYSRGKQECYRINYE